MQPLQHAKGAAPKNSAGKCRQIALEDLTAEPVHDQNTECVESEEKQVVSGRIKAGNPADEPVREYRQRPVKTAL